jgi:hypothetical protein
MNDPLETHDRVWALEMAQSARISHQAGSVQLAPIHLRMSQSLRPTPRPRWSRLAESSRFQ